MNGRDLTLGLVGALAVAGMATRRGSRAVVLPYVARPMGGDLYEVIEVRTGKRPRSGDGAWTEDEQDEVERVVERLNREAILRKLPSVGPSADWANEAWELSGGRVLFEDDNDDLIVLRADAPDMVEARYRTVGEAAAALGLGAPVGSAATTGPARRTRKAYTYSVYSYDKLVENVYGIWSSPPLDGSVLSGEALTKDEAFSRARLAADKVKWKGGITVMVWRHGRMVNPPRGFTLKMPQADERAR